MDPMHKCTESPQMDLINESYKHVPDNLSW